MLCTKYHHFKKNFDHCTRTSLSLVTEARRRLRSAASMSLDVRRTRLSNVGDRAFLVSAAHLWNSLPSHITAVPLSPHHSPDVVLNHISSHFLIPLSDYSLICTVLAQWLIILYTIIITTFKILHLTRSEVSSYRWCLLQIWDHMCIVHVSLNGKDVKMFVHDAQLHTEWALRQPWCNKVR